MSDGDQKKQRRWLRWMGRTVGTLLALGALGVLGLWLWLRVPSIDASEGEAITAFTEVMNGDWKKRPEAIAMLAGAIDRNPESGRAHLWFGLANLHGFLEHRELPYAIRASRAFEKAAELSDDPSAEGWRAFFAYQAAESRGEDMSGPTETLLTAAEADPSFTSFLAAAPFRPSSPSRSRRASTSQKRCYVNFWGDARRRASKRLYSDQRDFDRRIRQLVPGYMPMGRNGMAAMGDMDMPQPANSIPMRGGPGAFGRIDMGGMFTIFKVRESLGSYDDPGWYDYPEETMARPATAAELRADGIDVDG